MKIIVIIPTYNERENIQSLIPILQREFEAIPHQMEILVVDDSSPDKTADVVQEYASQYSNIHLLIGEKKGLGAAYIHGMQFALDTLNPDAVMEMDADFSHKPEDVKRLVAELESNDFVIGSRYVQGGKIPEDWGFLRKMNSKFGNLAARFIAGIYSIKDCTAGFRAIKASLLRQIDLQAIDGKGYCFQISLLHESYLRKAKIKEVPVEFIDRKFGESKLGLSDIFEFIFLVWSIRLESSRIFLKFLLVGLSGLVVNLGFFTLFLNLGLNKFIASPIAIEISIITNFFLNNFWTFSHKETQKNLRIKGLKFNLVSFFALAISYSTFILLSFMYSDWAPQIPQILGIIPATLANYFLNAYWTFKE